MMEIEMKKIHHFVQQSSKVMVMVGFSKLLKSNIIVMGYEI